MDRVEGRPNRRGTPEDAVIDARRRAAIARQRGGGLVSEAAYSDDTLLAMARRARPQQAREGAVKRFFKAVFLSVSGDMNEIG